MSTTEHSLECLVETAFISILSTVSSVVWVPFEHDLIEDERPYGIVKLTRGAQGDSGFYNDSIIELRIIGADDETFFAIDSALGCSSALRDYMNASFSGLTIDEIDGFSVEREALSTNRFQRLYSSGLAVGYSTQN